MKNRIINVQDVPISISQQELDDYICITDIAKAKTGESRSADVVKNWLRNRNLHILYFDYFILHSHFPLR